MKLCPTILISFALAGAASAQSIQFPSSAERWGVFEIVLSGPSTGNPYVDVSLGATFTRSGSSVNVTGFYDGGGSYKIRFMPPQEGSWSFATTSNQAVLSGRTGSFTATPPSSGNRGPVRVRDQFHFRYEDGTPYHHVGTTAYNWTNQTSALQDQTLQTLGQQRFNKLRFLIFPKYYVYNTDAPAVWPFEGSPHAWNYDRPVYAFWRNFENRVRQLRDMGIEADIIINNPYDGWGLSNIKNQRAKEDRHWRHLVARLSAYRNVWWSMSNEYEFWNTNDAYWDAMFQLIRDSDPVGHLRSIHNAFQVYDHAKSWVTHASLQGQDQTNFTMDLTRSLRTQYGKPIVWDEVKYEGDIDEGWGRLTPQEMTGRFWTGLTDGAYVGHSETYRHPQNIIWWSRGGVLHGGSPARIAFLEQTVRDFVPGLKLDPLPGDDRAAQNGTQCFVWYFGTTTSTSRSFTLPAGINYQAHVIDTWNMSRTDAGVRSGNFTLPVPNVPYLAVLFQAAGGTPPPPPPPDGPFVKGINFNGSAATIEGDAWTSHAGALSSGLSFPTAPRVWTSQIAPVPAVDAATNAMLNSAVWNDADFSFSQTLTNGAYSVYFWVLENHQSSYRSFDIRLEGSTAAAAVGTLSYGSWMKYGPYPVTVGDGALTVNVIKQFGDPHLMGMAIFGAGGTPPPPPPPPPPSGFVKGINFNGSAVTIGGNAWTSHAAALSSGLSFPSAPRLHAAQVSPVPAVDGATGAMLNSNVWNDTGFGFSQTVANGSYDVFLWVLENHQSNYRSFDLRLEGANAASGIGTMPLGTWAKYGPYRTSVGDGALSVDLIRNFGDPHVMGMEIYAAGATTPPTLPVVSVAVSDGSASEAGPNPGAFTVSRTGSTAQALTVAYTIGGTASPGGDYATLPGTATIPAGAGSATVPVTVVDDGLQEPDETVTLTVSASAAYSLGATTSGTLTIADNDAGTPPPPPPPPPPPAGGFVKGVNFNGSAATIEGNTWIGYGTALAGGLSFPQSPNVWTSQLTPSPAADGPTVAMLNSAVWSTDSFSFAQALPNGDYSVYFWVFENHQSNYRSFNVRLEGATVASGIGTLSYGVWAKYGPYPAAVSDGALSVDLVRNFGDPHLMGMAILGGTSAPPPPAVSNLALHWTLDGHAQDASGNGNHGTPSGAVWTSGKLGGGLDLGGSDDHVSVPASASLNSLKTQMTASLWVYKRANAPTYGGLAGRRYGPEWDDLWLLYYDNLNSDNYAFVLRTSNGSAILNGPASTGDHDAWVHVAAVYDGTSMILYLDGQEAARRGHTGTIPDETSPLVVSAGDNGTLGFDEFINAVVDDVRIYGRALSAAEVSGLHQQGGAAVLKSTALESTEEESGGGSCGLLGLEILLLLGCRRRRSR